jgi:predicted ATPase with chaperone activity
MTYPEKPAPSLDGSKMGDPPTPETIEELGIPGFMLQDLALRYLREHGTATLTMMRKGLKLSYSLVESTFQQLRQQQLIDIRGTVGSDYLFSLTGPARHYAAERSEICRYAGPVPVPLEQYTRLVRYQRTFIVPTVEELREAFADLVLSEEVLESLGPALTSGKPLFVYGPSGNGKTSIIERIQRIFEDSILIPHAIEVDGQIIAVFDPLVHRPVINETPSPSDERWIRCRRPCIMAAGELVSSMLDLRLDERSGVYAAPLQLKANNGILLIDDFGRQAMSPRELLNRWILPLDRRIDYLSLHYGLTFQIPFELILAFATNLSPSHLADEAFLRRVPNKIYINPSRDEDFDEIFRRVLQQNGLPFDPELAQYLRRLCRERNPDGLRACYPKDICDILVATAAYKRRPFDVSQESLARAANLYFTRQTDSLE